jgi:hypothetical protein
MNMSRIIVWTIIGFVSGFLDGYLWQNSPSFWMTILGVSMFGMMENVRWCMINNIRLDDYERTSHSAHTIKMFAMTVFPAMLLGNDLAFRLLNGYWYDPSL